MDDTIVVSAEKENIRDILFRLNCWYAIAISKEKWTQIKYLAVYESGPVSAITYVAKVQEIELIESIEQLRARVGEIKPEDIKSLNNELGEKCVLYLSEEGIGTVTPPIKKGKKVKGILGRRYTTYQKLQHAQQQKEPTLDDLF